LSSSGRCYVVIGNSAFAGVIIPTDSLIAQIAKDVGFSSINVYVVRPLTVAPQQRITLNGMQKYMRESIVVLGT
jgi:site-specific DNA-methyltransferase (adenine-specific)